jgi:energy-coupling factor transporter ATP-binding protein EcfA2
MRLAAITCRNFRCHDDTRFDLQPVTLFTGPNGSGKSSIAEALRLALSGKTETLNDRNEGIADLILRGQKQAEIVVELPEGDSIIRRIPGGLSITGNTSTTNQKDAEAALALMMGARPDQARTALGPHLWKLDSKNRKETLGDLLRLYYTAEDVRAALEAQGEVAGLSLAGLAREVCGSITNDLAGMESRARDARAACKKDLERAQHRLEELRKQVGEEDDQVADVPPPDHATLQQARLEVSRLVGVQRQFDQAEQEHQKALGRLQQLTEELGDRVPVPPEVFQQGQQRLRQRQQELQAAEVALRERNHAVETGRAASEQLKRIEAEIHLANAGNCPTCGGPTQPDPMVVQDLERRRRELSDRVQACKQTLTRFTTTDQDLPSLRRMVETGTAWVETQNRLRWLGGSLQEARQRVADAEQRLAGMERPDPAAEEAARARRDELEQQDAWSREWQAHAARVNAEKREVEALTFRRDALNNLCGYLGPNGFRHQILQARIEPLVNEVNGILEKWGMSVSYEVGTLDLLVSTPRAAEPVPYHLLSDGEQVLVQLAHQAFLAVACGVRILVLDRIEALDRTAQQKLFRAAFDLAGPTGLVDHVLLMGVSVDGGAIVFPDGVGPDQGFKRHNLTHGRTAPELQAKTTKTTRRKTA